MDGPRTPPRPVWRRSDAAGPAPVRPGTGRRAGVAGPRRRPGLTARDIAEARRHPGLDLLAGQDLTLGGRFTVEDRRVPGPPGGPDVTLLICRPAAPRTPGPLPVLYYAHGGGMVLGTRRTGVEVPLEWASELDAVVVSVEYRLAPEHPYPAAVDDVYAGLLWLAGHAAQIGADPGRIVAAGSSAGGGLCAALALLARDRRGPRPFAQVLLSRCSTTATTRRRRGRCPAGGCGTARPTRPPGPRSSATCGAVRRARLRGSGPGGGPVRAAAGLPRRRFGGDLPRRGRRLRHTDLAGRRRRRTPRLARGFHGFDGLAPGAALTRAARAARLDWLRRLLVR